MSDPKQKEALHEAEKRTLEMVADGASLKDVLDQLCASIDVQVAPSVTTVFVMDADGKHLLLTGGPRVPGQWISAVSPRPVTHECGLCGKAAFLKKRVIVADVATDPGWPDEYRELALSNGIRAAWSEPLRTKDNEVLGTFALYSHEARVPTEEDLALIKGAGYIARIAIERQRSQEALRNALDEVQRSEAKLRRVIDTVPTLAWRKLPDGSKDFLNKRWYDYTGLSAEESYGWGWQSAVHPEDLPSLLERWRQIRTSEKPAEIEVRVRRYDGVYRWFLIRVGAERFWSPHYIQHSAHIPPGREGLFNLVKSLPPTLKYEHGTIVADGDFVIVHGRFSGFQPTNWIAADILRIKDGIFLEHWDVIQDEATKAESKSGLPMFSDKFKK